METDRNDRKWVVVRIDGKIAAISTDYRLLAEIAARIAGEGQGKRGKGALTLPYERITAEVVPFAQVWEMRGNVRWEDLMLYGTDFQKKVWRRLWELTHQSEPGPAATEEEHVGNRQMPARPEEQSAQQQKESKHENDLPGNAGLICYSDFAELCENRAGVRAVAHAIGLNPISVIIPCHLVIPKESIDKMNAIRTKAESTIFKGEDLCLGSIVKDESIDFGEYSLGRNLKRMLIGLELTGDAF